MKHILAHEEHTVLARQHELDHTSTEYQVSGAKYYLP